MAKRSEKIGHAASSHSERGKPYEIVDDQELEWRRREFLARMNERVADIKLELEAFIARFHESDDVCLTSALLETGFERQIDLLGEAEALRFMKRDFEKVAKKYRLTLQ